MLIVVPDNILHSDTAFLYVCIAKQADSLSVCMQITNGDNDPNGIPKVGVGLLLLVLWLRVVAPFWSFSLCVQFDDENARVITAMATEIGYARLLYCSLTCVRTASSAALCCRFDPSVALSSTTTRVFLLVFRFPISPSRILMILNARAGAILAIFSVCVLCSDPSVLDRSDTRTR